MGIGGSAASAVAAIAHAQKHQVSGCDLDPTSPYLKPLKKSQIRIYKEHSESHLKNIDILTISPAIPYISGDNQEYLSAKEKGIAMTWQEFMGKYLHHGKRVICVSGTHGKSTTTALLGLCFEEAKLDPTVEVGATVIKWKSNYRIGKSVYFISEADEFNNNFLNYHPEIIILNNIEMDHPEFFANIEEVNQSFLKFISNLTGEKTLIVNLDDANNQSLITNHKTFLNDNHIKIIGLTLKHNFLDFVDQIFSAKIERQGSDGIAFSVEIKSPESSIPLERFKISLTGLHNVSNALGVIAAAKIFNLPLISIKKTLLSYQGTGRRLEEVIEKSGIKIIIDYAHHPTAVMATIEACKQKYPTRNIWVVFQPHMYTRLKLFLNAFADSLNLAHRITLLPVYASRDTSTLGLSSANLYELLPKSKVRLTHSFEEAAVEVATESKSGDIILIMGAGDVYKLIPLIKEKL